MGPTSMDAVLDILLGIPIAAWLWLAVLATMAVRRDSTIDPLRSKLQIAVAWLVPILGAAAVLHVVNQNSPGAIPRALVPWPFKALAFPKSVASNRNRDDNEGPGKDLAVSEHYSSYVDHGGGGDSGN